MLHFLDLSPEGLLRICFLFLLVGGVVPSRMLGM